MSKVLKPLTSETIDHVQTLIDDSVKYEILSIGVGVQSSTLWLMNLKGLIEPRAEFAVFADTMRERHGTYEYLDYLDEQSEIAGFPPIMRITAGDIINDTLNPEKGVDIPFWTDSRTGQKVGQLNRQCTGRFKIEVVKREVRRIFGMKKRVQWIGFSMDELVRRNDTIYPKYITPRYPLLEMRMSRADCKTWLKENGHPEPVKSSCTICPFRSDSEWAEMAEKHPDEFGEAVRFDEDSRELVPPPRKRATNSRCSQCQTRNIMSFYIRANNRYHKSNLEAVKTQILTGVAAFVRFSSQARQALCQKLSLS